MRQYIMGMVRSKSRLLTVREVPEPRAADHSWLERTGILTE